MLLLFTLKLFFNSRFSCNNIYLVSSNVFCHEISQSCTNKTIKILKHSNQHKILGSVPSLHIYHMQYWYFLLFYYYDSQDMIHQYVMMMMSIRCREKIYWSWLGFYNYLLVKRIQIWNALTLFLLSLS